MRRVSLDDLQLGMFVQKMEVWWVKHPLLHNEMLLTDQAQLDAMRECGITEVFINPARGQKIEPKRVMQPAVSVAEELSQAQAILDDARAPMMALFGEARMGKSVDVQTTLPLVSRVADSVERSPQALISVARLKNHDDYTYLHSVAVCTLMIALARQMKLSEDEVRIAGLGGLLHDVGKSAIPLEILNKPGKLTDEEFEVIKAHPLAGADKLRVAGAEWKVVDIALHHHEKMNGRGYPHALSGIAISQLARMCAVCDVYDALTSVRAYKSGWNPAAALQQMASWQGHFDRDILTEFMQTVGIYPVGSLVRLASERVAMVVEPGSEPLTPQVTVFWSLADDCALTPQRLDLSDATLAESILGVEESERWNNLTLLSPALQIPA